MKNINTNIMPSLGHHVGTIVKNKDGSYFEDAVNRNNKHYRQLTIVTTKGETLRPQLYDGFMSVFYTQIWRQTRGATGGMKDSEVFEYLSTHQFDIWVDINDEYAWPQYSYAEPKKGTEEA